ncbi:hypothetical protein BJ546DRAFT_987614, partial [Cryomyces antarcticus]
MEDVMGMAPTQGTATAAARRSRAKSCTTCRQVKLRCDTKQTFPSACSRCKSNRLECRMDSSFKRVPARRRVEELTNQLSKIQRTLTLEQVAESSDNIWGNALRTRPRASRSASNASVTPLSVTGTSSRWFDRTEHQQRLAHHEQWTIGDVTIEHFTIVDLLLQFEQFYYPHCPILEPIASPQELFGKSDLLFWTVVLTASRHHPQHSPLYEQMLQPFLDMFCGTFRCSIQYLESLQAVLVICCWPIEVIAQSDDPTSG